MTETRPSSKLPDGTPNPDYHRWYRAKKAAEKVAKKAPKPAKAAVALIELPEVLGELDSREAHILPSAGSIPAPATFLTLKCVKSAKNPSWVFCDLNGVKVPVRCKRGLSKKLPGKRINVTVETVGEKTTYTHKR